MNKYEKLIEHIINGDESAARALFHDIVVAKSRSIYENLMDDDAEDIGGNPVGDLEDDISSDEDMDVGDEADLGDDVGVDAGDDSNEDGDLEDRVMDLESALDELKAEFDSLMADEEGEAEHHDGVTDPDFEDMGDEEEEESEEESDLDMDAGDEEEASAKPFESRQRKSEIDLMREYVEKVSMGHGAEKKGAVEGQEVGTGKSVGVNKRSTIDNMKNDMGGSTANIARGGDEGAMPTASKDANNAYTKGRGTLKGAERNVNQPGGNGASKFYNTKASAKKGDGQTTDGSVAVNDNSPVAK